MMRHLLATTVGATYRRAPRACSRRVFPIGPPDLVVTSLRAPGESRKSAVFFGVTTRLEGSGVAEDRYANFGLFSAGSPVSVTT